MGSFLSHAYRAGRLDLVWGPFTEFFPPHSACERSPTTIRHPPSRLSICTDVLLSQSILGNEFFRKISLKKPSQYWRTRRQGAPFRRTVRAPLVLSPLLRYLPTCCSETPRAWPAMEPPCCVMSGTPKQQALATPSAATFFECADPAKRSG